MVGTGEETSATVMMEQVSCPSMLGTDGLWMVSSALEATVTEKIRQCSQELINIWPGSKITCNIFNNLTPDSVPPVTVLYISVHILTLQFFGFVPYEFSHKNLLFILKNLGKDI